jgi:hypothetical protein
MDKEFKQRAIESADRMARAGMTLSAGIMQELIAEVERLGVANAAETDYIHFLEAELTRAHAHNNAELEGMKELGEENPQIRELHLGQMVLAGEINN